MARNLNSLSMVRLLAALTFWRRAAARYRRRLDGLSRYPWPMQFKPRFVFAGPPTRWLARRATQRGLSFSDRELSRGVLNRQSPVVKAARTAAVASPGKALRTLALLHPPRSISHVRATLPASGGGRGLAIHDDIQAKRAGVRIVIAARTGLARVGGGRRGQYRAVLRDVRLRAAERHTARPPVARAGQRVEHSSAYRLDARARTDRVSIGSRHRASSITERHAWRNHIRAPQVSRAQRHNKVAVRRLIGLTEVRYRQRKRRSRSFSPWTTLEGGAGKRRYRQTRRAGRHSNRQRAPTMVGLALAQVNRAVARMSRARRAAHAPAPVTQSPCARYLPRRAGKAAAVPSARLVARLRALDGRRLSIVTSRQALRSFDLFAAAPVRMTVRQRTASGGPRAGGMGASTHVGAMPDSGRAFMSSQGVLAHDQADSEQAIADARRILLPLVQEALLSDQTIEHLTKGVAMQIDRRDSDEQYRKSGGR